jgi:hypothetical protein
VGQPAPELQKIKGWLFGKPVRLADLRGQHVLLHFWNMQSEFQMPALMLLHEMFGDQGLGIMIVFPDFGRAVEDTAQALAEDKRRYWSGREPPFPVALDGGGETPIKGTQLKTPGATHAAYRIPYGHRGTRLYATTLLIGPDGKILQQVYPNAGERSIADFERLLGKKARTPGWRERFDLLYSLSIGQVLRRVEPPFPPERSEYLFYLQPLGAAQGTHLFRYFCGKVSAYATSGRERLSLAEALHFAVGLKSYDYEGPADLLKLEVSGDWVAQQGAMPAQLLLGFETILVFRQALIVG